MGHLDQRRAKPLEELSPVRLATALSAGEGTLPVGSEGTIVYVYRTGDAYEVEFFQPFHAVVTVPASDLI